MTVDGDKTGSSSHRADIQGLRAVAVGLVVLDHVFQFPAGGFIGVDVFFVISGFLITSLMLRELDKTGSISFRRFYARRMRRIMPAAIAVLVFTVVVSAALWFPMKATGVAIDAVWAFLFMSNWHFQVAGSDYFAAGFGRSPLLHYWSLSIEEQFYAIWPLVLLFVALLARRSRGAINFLIVSGICLSLAWAAYISQSDRSGAYFDSFARAWELLLGALVAAVGSAGPRVSLAFRRGAQRAGLALIAGNAVLVSPSWSLPFPWVGPAVVGAALVIWASAPVSTGTILGNRFAQRLGDVSYSLYLWHFPIIIFSAVVLGPHWWVKILAIALMLSAAEASRKWIEEPFLNGSLLARATQVENGKPWVWRDVLLGLTASVVMLAMIAITTMRPALHNAASVVRRVSAVLAISPPQSSTDTERHGLVRAALAATSWPSSMNDFGAWKLALETAGKPCVNDVANPDPGWCGEPVGAQWLLVGDSVAMSLKPAVNAAGAERGYQVASIGYGGCQLSDGLKYTHPVFGESFPANCANAQLRTLERIRALKPQVVILTGHAGVLERLGLPLAEAEAVWRQHYEAMLAKLDMVQTVVVIESTPWTRGNGDCANRLAGPSPCVTELDAWHRAKARAERAAVANVENSVFIPSSDWFCSDGICPPVVGNTLVTVDGLHLTFSASLALKDLIGSEVDEAINRTRGH